VDERGSVMHMLRNDNSHFEQFGEIYFSTVNPGKVKGWHLHKKMTLNYAVVAGKIRLVLYDERTDSPTRGLVEEFELSENNYCLLTIPPGIWNGFQGLGKIPSIIANCASHPHDPDEIVRLKHDIPQIPYCWS
jgi:dTDP-4-dehydrorhamnose 3,5-epimerase